jgi:hypothetical protein
MNTFINQLHGTWQAAYSYDIGISMANRTGNFRYHNQGQYLQPTYQYPNGAYGPQQLPAPSPAPPNGTWYQNVHQPPAPYPAAVQHQPLYPSPSSTVTPATRGEPERKRMKTEILDTPPPRMADLSEAPQLTTIEDPLWMRQQIMGMPISML